MGLILLNISLEFKFSKFSLFWFKDHLCEVISIKASNMEKLKAYFLLSVKHVCSFMENLT